MASRNKASQTVGGLVEFFREARAFVYLCARGDVRDQRVEEAGRFITARAGCEDCLSGPWRNGEGSRGRRSGQMTGALKLVREPRRQGSGLANRPQRAIRARGGAVSGSNDVSAVPTDVDLPGQGPLS